LASRLLKQAGYSVVTASDGAEALRSLEALGTQPRALNRPPVDLVVSDVVMPILSGRELGEALCQRYPGLPVLYMSGYPGPEIISRGLLAEGVEFVQKPFRPDHLLVKVRSLLDGIPTT
jgi:CheY-like chemotaxis protein